MKVFGKREKREEIRLSHMTKAPTPTDKSKKQRDNLTRAPRGTDRSPEYNGYFCEKLDFLANQKA